MQHVFSGQQAVNVGLADRERAEHQRAVRNGFVARHPDGSRQRTGGSGLERPGRHGTSQDETELLAHRD
jgi:hypothetical protein